MQSEPIATMFAERFATTWNGRDGSGYGEAYWPDAELVDPTGTIWTGRKAIADMHVDLRNGPARDARVIASVRCTKPLSPTLAVVDLDVEVTGFSPAPLGATCGLDGIVRTHLKHVIEKRETEWKIIASQNTFVAAIGR